MMLNDSADSFRGSVPEEDRRASLLLMIDLLESLENISQALKQSAVETREEILGYPWNLLAAFDRVCSQVEYFLRLTNPGRTSVNGMPGTAQDYLAEFRTEISQRTEEIGIALQCANGFVEYPVLKASEPQCQEWLRTAAPLIEGLGQRFIEAREFFLLAVFPNSGASTDLTNPSVPTSENGGTIHVGKPGKDSL